MLTEFVWGGIHRQRETKASPSFIIRVILSMITSPICSLLLVSDRHNVIDAGQYILRLYYNAEVCP